jgi:hypothetical protein
LIQTSIATRSTPSIRGQAVPERARWDTSGPLELGLAMQRLARAEQLVGISRIETGTVVANENERNALTDKKKISKLLIR